MTAPLTSQPSRAAGGTHYPIWRPTHSYVVTAAVHAADAQSTTPAQIVRFLAHTLAAMPESPCVEACVVDILVRYGSAATAALASRRSSASRP
jgi:hypothetical protein